MKKHQGMQRIGCGGWFAILLFISLSILAFNSSQEARIAEEKRLAEEAIEQEWEDEVERQRVEYERRKTLEETTKVKLTSDMISNQPGETVDIYGVKLTVSKPYETVLNMDEQLEDTKKRMAQKKSKVVTFDITVLNDTDVEVSIQRLQLTRLSYTIPRKSDWDRIYRYPSEDMDRYISKNSFSRDPILPGEERTGTVSFFIDQFDLNPSKRAKEHGAGIFRFSIDVSNFPFLNSFENNKIYYKQKIGWDTHHVRMTFDVE